MNIPNIITLGRIILVPVIVWAIASNQMEVAFAVFVIAGVSDACREVGALNKVIIEACYLTDEEKVVACRLAQLARADFVKTSTGFGPGGATVFDVALMRETVGLKMGVKAAGGIHDANDARAMITAGANRIGASAGIRIVSGDEGGSGESY